MHTLRIKIHDKVYNKFIWLLSKFSEDEIEIIEEDESYLKTQEYLKHELNEMNEGKSEYFSIDELDDRLEKKISSHENHS